MKRLIIFLAFSLLAIGAMGQGYYSRYHTDRAQCKLAKKWLKSGHWRNGFVKADPHETVSAIDFYLQYQKNPDQWKALFEWLEDTDLLALPAGRIPIPGSTLVASVEDDINRDLRDQRSESHFRHIDFQYVVKGSERFGIIDHYTSRPSGPYKPDVVHYDYDLKKTKFYDSSPKKFFLFFPGDWHIAKLKTNRDDQKIRVIVVKLDYM